MSLYVATKPKMTKIINEQPPVYDMIIASGMRFNPASTVFAYDGAIYNPANAEIPDHCIAHEETHLRQQETIGSVAWWDRYLVDPLFRIQQEAEAYGAQYRFLCQRIKDRNRRNRILVDLSTFLSGPMYGNTIDALTARKMILKEAGE